MRFDKFTFKAQEAVEGTAETARRLKNQKILNGEYKNGDKVTVDIDSKSGKLKI